MKNKHRLYVTLHVRGGKRRMPGGEDNYHWGLLLAAKDDVQTVNTLIHARETITPTGTSQWFLSTEEQSPTRRHAILVRVLVAKIHDLEAAKSILQSTPVRDGQDHGPAPSISQSTASAVDFTEHRDGYRAWNCISWVREALYNLSASYALGQNVTGEWERIRDESLAYVERKKAEHRFDGQAEPGRFDMDLIPTWDLLQGRETVE